MTTGCAGSGSGNWLFTKIGNERSCTLLGVVATTAAASLSLTTRTVDGVVSKVVACVAACVVDDCGTTVAVVTSGSVGAVTSGGNTTVMGAAVVEVVDRTEVVVEVDVAGAAITVARTVVVVVDVDVVDVVVATFARATVELVVDLIVASVGTVITGRSVVDVVAID